MKVSEWTSGEVEKDSRVCSERRTRGSSLSFWIWISDQYTLYLIYYLWLLGVHVTTFHAADTVLDLVLVEQVGTRIKVNFPCIVLHT